MSGSEREAQKAKQAPDHDVAKRADRDADMRAEDADPADRTSHADRQLAMRMNAKQTAVNFTEVMGPDREFGDTGADQSALWPAVRAILDGKADAKDLATKVADLDREGRDKVALRMRDVAKVSSAAATLQIGDLVGLTPAGTVRAALDAALDLRALHAHIAAMTSSDLIELFDAPTRANVAARNVAPAELVPQLSGLDSTLARSVELVDWYVSGTPALAVARAMLRLSSDTAGIVSTTLNQIGRHAWDWVFAATEAMVAAAPSVGIELEMKPAFEDVASALKARSPAHAFRSQPGAAPGGAKELQRLVPVGGIDIGALTKAMGTASSFEHNELDALRRSPYRERMIAALTVEQLVTVMELMLATDDEKLDWLLDSPRLLIGDVLAHSATWSAASVRDALAAPKTLTRLAARFPDAGPADLFGANRDGVYEIAQSNRLVRAWCIQAAQPIDILHIITFSRATIGKMWTTMVAEGLSPMWVQRLGIGDKGDTRFRSLALACPDPTAAGWIRDHLIGDKIETQHVDNRVVAIPAVAKEADPNQRLAEGMGNEDVRGPELGKRVGEMSDADIAKLRDDPARLAELLERLDDHWLTRVLFLVQPPLSMVIEHAYLRAAGLPAYIRTRPAAETAAAFADEHRRAKILEHVRMPLVMLPALEDPGVLARAAKHPEVLEWLLREVDAPHAISLLGHPEVARAVGPVFSRAHLELVPETLALSKSQRHALEQLANAIPKEALSSRLRERLENQPDAREPDEKAEKPAESATTAKKAQVVQDELEIALGHRDLAGALDVVLVEPPHRANVLAVCRERAGGAVELLSKPEHAARAGRLFDALQTSPVAVFPGVPWFAFLHSEVARRWLFEQEPPSEILHELVTDPQLAKLVFELGENDAGFRGWMDRLPKGSALGAKERRQLRALFDGTTSNVVARRLFEIRFVGRITPKSFQREEIARFWTIFERVPEAHTSQGSIQHLNESKNSTPGMFGGGNMHLDDKLVAEGRNNTEYDVDHPMTKGELVQAYGYNDLQIEARIQAGELERVDTDKGERFRIKQQTVKLLDFTVLHEIGHSVDEMLGERTELIYGLAGWRAYGESDIGALGEDMGGWDRVKPDDKRKIEEVWASWINTRAYDSLDTLVDHRHPALSEDYKGVGIVDFARAKKPPLLGHAPPIHGHHLAANTKNQQIYRIPERTRNAAPSRYALTAPQEYFAECYAEYYYAFTGPGTEDKKGGRLAGWIKSWFDENVDSLEHNPKRE